MRGSAHRVVDLVTWTKTAWLTTVRIAALLPGIVGVTPVIVAAAGRAPRGAVVAVGALDLDRWVDDDASGVADEWQRHPIAPRAHAAEANKARDAPLKAVALAGEFGGAIALRARVRAIERASSTTRTCEGV